jgi:eukaryotic-like serine/threonine-protein kinase
MAEVFKGKSISMEGFERLVAIKRVLPSLVENKKFLGMFLDEAKLSLTLNHANIVQVFDLGRAGETYFIVMEYVEGTNLKKVTDWLHKRNMRMGLPEAVYVIGEVCKGLAHAHQKRDLQGRYMGIVHRDVSPPNILLSTEGEVKLTDFGLAKARSQVETTDPGVVKGKFAYLSPEAAYGDDVDPLTDIFACGIVLWEAVTGRRLFLGETDLKTLELVRRAEVPPLTDYHREAPAALDAICRRALARDKKERYATVRDLGRDLSEFLFSHGMSVNAYDLSTVVRQVMRDSEIGRKPKSSKHIMSLVQKEVENIIRIAQEGVDEAQVVDALAADPRSRPEASPVSTVMEDPRTWSNLFGEDEALDPTHPEPTHPSAPSPVPLTDRGLPPETSDVQQARLMRAGDVFKGRPQAIPGAALDEPTVRTSADASGPALFPVAEGRPGPRMLRPVLYAGAAVILALTVVLFLLLAL